MREKIISMKEIRENGSACDTIRKEISAELAEKWQDTKEKRKAYRAIASAVEATNNENMMYYIGQADEIIGNREW